MKIELSKLNYKFKNKPLLIAGMAMDFYNLRKVGDDIDFVVAYEDYKELTKMYPQNTVDLFGDLGVRVFEFEIWAYITLFDYHFLSQDALEENEFKIISLDKLILLKTLAAYDQKKKDQAKYTKYAKDVDLLIQKIENIQYGKDNQFTSDSFKKKNN